jgi:hypothetical protein
MAKTKQTFNKRQKEITRLKHREDKAAKKKERQANSSGGGLENMMAWVDENGQLTSVPQPLVRQPRKEDDEAAKPE